MFLTYVLVLVQLSLVWSLRTPATLLPRLTAPLRASLMEPPLTATTTTTTKMTRSSASKVTSANILDGGKTVRVQFDDKSCFAFHALWLRDACRDDHHVVRVAGERQLTATAAMLAKPDDLVATSIDMTEDGGLTVRWGGDGTMVGGVDNSVEDSTFTSAFLHSYADVVAKPLAAKPAPWRRPDLEWLRPYTGYPDAQAPLPGSTRLPLGRSLTHAPSLLKRHAQFPPRRGPFPWASPSPIPLPHPGPLPHPRPSHRLHHFVDQR